MKKIFALILIGFTAAAFAQEAKPAESEAKSEVVTLSIDEAVEYALKNSRTLKSNDIDLELKARASKYSWNVFLPNVQASGTMSRANEYNPSSAATAAAINGALKMNVLPVKTDYATEEERWSTVGNISASWTFTPAYIAKIKVAKAQYEAGKVSWEQSQNETITNIKKLYYGLLLQQENLKIKKTTLENARQRMNQAATNFNNGSIPEIQYLQTQVNYENTKPEVDSAEQAFVQQMDYHAYLRALFLSDTHYM